MRSIIPTGPPGRAQLFRTFFLTFFYFLDMIEQTKLAEALTAARLRKANARKGTAAGHAVAAHGGQGDTRPVKCEPAEVIRPGASPPDAVGIPVI